jgi:tetratricopeptide (TPR) repeat protein
MRPTENLAAYEAFLQGRQHLARRTTLSIAEATNYFQQAVNLDPQFALAYAGLADAWQLQVDYGGLAVTAAIARAQPLVEKALQLDDQLGEAYNSLASIREYAGDYDAADRNYRRALELAPNYADAAHWYGLFLMQSLGLPQRSVPWFEKALELDPLSAITLSNYANALEQLGRFDESLGAIQKSLSMHAEFVLAPASMAYFEASVNGRRDEAIRWTLNALAIDPGEPVANADLAWLFSELGDQRAASCWLARARELGPTSAFTTSTQALHALYTGDHEQAISAALVSLENVWVRSTKALPLAVFKVIRQQQGRSDEVLQQYEIHYPEHFAAQSGDFTRANFRAAIDLAEVLAESGRVSESGQLLEAAWSFIDDIPRLGTAGFGVNDARILLLRGDSEAALAALEEAVQAGWRTDWRFYLEYDSVLAPLRGNPRFEAAVDDIRRDMAEQLERVRAAGHDFGPCAEGLL